MKYEWTMASLYPDLEPQVAGEHLETLVEKYQENLTAEEILADARKQSSPLHSAFDWDENEAAEKWRLKQARQITQNLVVRGKSKKKTRAFVFVRVPKHGRKCYVPIRSAMAQPELKAQVIENAYRMLEHWIGRYGSSRALAGVHRDVERLRRRVEVEMLTAAGII